MAAAIRTTTLRDLTVADPPMDEVVQAIYREADLAKTGTS